MNGRSVVVARRSSRSSRSREPTRETKKSRGGRARGGARARTESTHVGRSCVPASSVTFSRCLTPPCRASGASGSERRTRSWRREERNSFTRRCCSGRRTARRRVENQREEKEHLVCAQHDAPPRRTTRRPRGAPTRPRGSCFPPWSRGARGHRTRPRRRSPRTWTAPAWKTSLAPPRARISR